MMLSTCRKVSKPWITTVTTKQFHRNTGTRKMQRKDWIHSHTQLDGERRRLLQIWSLSTHRSRVLFNDWGRIRGIRGLYSVWPDQKKTSPWRINNWTQEWRGGFLVWWKLIPFSLSLCSGRRWTGAYTFVNHALNESRTLVHALCYMVGKHNLHF